MKFQKKNSLIFQSLAIVFVLTGCGDGSESGPSFNEPPTGKADSYTLASGISITVPAPGVLANDLDPNGDKLSAELVESATLGVVTVNSDGSFIYSPSLAFNGLDKFSYVITDGEFSSDPIEVRVTLPNVILFLVDDMGQGDTLVFNPGAAIPTPNLELIANEGVSFSHAHSTAALCSATRYSVLTGNHPFRAEQSWGVWNSYAPKTMIRNNQRTVGNAFQEAGYRTAFIGKMHNGGAFWNQGGDAYSSDHQTIDFTRPFDKGPTQFGFDYSFVLPAGVSGEPYAYFENDLLVRYDEIMGKYVPFTDSVDAQNHFQFVEKGAKHNGGRVGSAGFAMDNYDSRSVGPILTRKVLDFLDFALNADNPSQWSSPFFVYYATPQLHAPWTPPAYFNISESNEVNLDIDGIPIANQTIISDRTDMVYQLDVMLGILIEYLEQKEILDNTIIVFTSDNGANISGEQEGYEGIGERLETGRSSEIHYNAQGIDGISPLRGSKAKIYEGGHRVPLIIRWGDGQYGGAWFPPGTSTNQIVGLHDLAATFSQITGTTIPVGQFNDSVSFIPGENNDAVVARQRMVIQGSIHSSIDGNHIDRAYYRIDTDSNLWKLSVDSNVKYPALDLTWKELYNLTTDPGELENRYTNLDDQGWLEIMQSEYLDFLATAGAVQ